MFVFVSVSRIHSYLEISTMRRKLWYDGYSVQFTLWYDGYSVQFTLWYEKDAFATPTRWCGGAIM